MLRKYQGENLRLDSPCPSGLCHMTLSRVGFLTLAPGNEGEMPLSLVGRPMHSKCYIQGPCETLTSSVRWYGLHRSSCCFENSLSRTDRVEAGEISNQVAELKKKKNQRCGIWFGLVEAALRPQLSCPRRLLWCVMGERRTSKAAASCCLALGGQKMHIWTNHLTWQWRQDRRVEGCELSLSHGNIIKITTNCWTAIN